MAARAVWKGTIRLDGADGAEVPVKLYSAVEDRQVRFRLLHEEDLVPVQQRMVDPGSGEPVPYEEIRKAYELEDGRLVVLDDEELAEVEPEPSRDIEITRFVPAGAIGPAWYDRPYWLGPDGRTGAYFALARALERGARQGIARWTMRKKEYRGALRFRGGHLMLVTLKSPAEVVDASLLEAPGGREAEKRELAMAEQLVGALEDEFDPTAYEDRYRHRVMEMVMAKAEGKTVELAAYERRKPKEESLASALEQSLRAARKERGVA